jgi:hypothetical protein
VALTAKIATVATPYDIAINAGSNAGVSANDVVKIITNTPVLDPVTGETLGHLQSINLTLKVVWTSQRFSLARTITYVGSPRRLKIMTTVQPEADARTVYVAPGMDVTIETPQPAPKSEELDIDDLPF